MNNIKPIAVFDIDGTIFRSSLLIELVDALITKRVFPVAARQQINTAYGTWLQREKVGAYEEYLDAVIRVYERYIKAASVETIHDVASEVVETMHRYSYVYTRDLTRKLQSSHFMIAISGSPRELVERFTQKWGFDDFAASTYLTDGTRYTGKFVKTHTNKASTLKKMASKHGLSLKRLVAVGDSGGDIDLLEMAEQAIAFNPDHALRQAALKRGWRIVVERKSQIYELEQQNGSFVLVSPNS